MSPEQRAGISETIGELEASFDIIEAMARQVDCNR